MKVFNSLDAVCGVTPVERVLDGIATSKKMLVVCGAGVSVSAGIPDFRSTTGLWNQPIVPAQPGRPGIKGSEFFSTSSNATGDRLGQLNALMARFRVHARVAQLTPFHQFLHKAMDTGSIFRCLTRNFDGLETRDRPDLSPRVSMLHGDNRVLTCPNLNCPNIEGAEVANFDELLASSGSVECPYCLSTREFCAKEKKRFRGQVQKLRPAVFLDERFDPEIQLGYLETVLFREMDGCDTMLILGTSLKSKGAYDLIRELAGHVHDSEGAVIYVESSDLKPSRFGQIVDFHLKVDLQECCVEIQRRMDKNLQDTAANIWIELSETVIEGEILDAAPELTKPACCQCALTLTDNIMSCLSCGYFYCYEIPGQVEGRMCVVLDYFSESSSSVDFQERVSSFLCEECYDRSAGIYPHFMRIAPFYALEPENPPRLVFILYYLSQFWPVAQNLMATVTCAWKATGWAYYSAAVRLQSLAHQTELLPECTWDPRTYKVMIVYVTHGTSGQQRYQLADDWELEPSEFLDATLKPAQRILEGAEFSSAYLLTCGYPYDSPWNVGSIQDWLDNKGLLHSIVGTMNKRLMIAYLVNLVANSAVELLGYHTWTRRMILDNWLRDSLASTHTDLIFFARQEEPTRLCFSPFQTRPLGKDLPSLLTNCDCGATDSGPVGRRKIWEVSHDGHHDKKLKDVLVTVRCSFCGRRWTLQEPRLPGILVKIGGLYAAEVPYFLVV